MHEHPTHVDHTQHYARHQGDREGEAQLTPLQAVASARRARLAAGRPISGHVAVSGIVSARQRLLLPAANLGNSRGGHEPRDCMAKVPKLAVPWKARSVTSDSWR